MLQHKRVNALIKLNGFAKVLAIFNQGNFNKVPHLIGGIFDFGEFSTP